MRNVSLSGFVASRCSRNNSHLSNLFRTRCVLHSLVLVSRYSGARSLSLSLWSSPRPISTAKLNTSPHLHTQPINLVVFKGSYSYDGISNLGVCFTLRCFQRLSVPYIAAQLCHWRDNWCTRGTSIPVLSY